MAATPISATTRYIPEGVTHFYWLTACADISAPTRSELDAGVDLTPEVAAMGNWGVTSAAVDAPDLKSRFVPQVPGLITIDGPTLSVYLSEEDDAADVRSVLPRDTEGFMVKFPEGDVSGNTLDVFPCKVASLAKPTALGGTVAVAELTFTVTAEPAENVTVPA
jgi:hypothetical protein